MTKSQDTTTVAAQTTVAAEATPVAGNTTVSAAGTEAPADSNATTTGTDVTTSGNESIRYGTASGQLHLLIIFLFNFALSYLLLWKAHKEFQNAMNTKFQIFHKHLKLIFCYYIFKLSYV